MGCRAAGWVAHGASRNTTLVPWGPLEQQQRWEWLWAPGMGAHLELKESEALPMAGLWPGGQSLNKRLAGGDPARVQGVGRPLRRCSSHQELQAGGLGWGEELLTGS